MDKKIAYLSSKFFFSRLKKTCNQIGCDKRPEIEAAVYERELGTDKKKELASIYLCMAHSEIKEILKDLGRMTSKNKKICCDMKRIRGPVMQKRYLTY
jgi:hypothetical protein